MEFVAFFWVFFGVVAAVNNNHPESISVGAFIMAAAFYIGAKIDGINRP